MASKTIPEKVLRFYSMPKPDIFSRGVPARLPEAYKKFYEAWNATPSPVHWRPEKGRWKRDPLTGEVWPVQNVPIQTVRYPDEVHTGIWGGEGCIIGLKRQRKYIQASTKWFMPTLYKSAVYSEILDKRLSLIVTKRTINLVMEHYGFDNYLLETSECDLYSLLALKLKKKMLLALFDKTLYPDDPVKQEKVYNKYKHHLEKFNKEDLEWYGLSVGEAVDKLMDMEDEIKPVPLKHQYRHEIIEEIKIMAANEELDRLTKLEKDDGTTWLSKINPFSKSS